ncbi:hypothetical protein ACS0TY_002764 [Phlomoides rotata]
MQCKMRGSPYESSSMCFSSSKCVAISSGSSTPDVPKGIKDLNCSNLRSQTTNTDEDWGVVASTEELRVLGGICYSEIGE